MENGTQGSYPTQYILIFCGSGKWQRKVVELLFHAKRPMSVREINRHFGLDIQGGKDKSLLRNILANLIQRNSHIKKVSRGMFQFVYPRVGEDDRQLLLPFGNITYGYED